jgi:hypothetical protein
VNKAALDAGLDHRGRSRRALLRGAAGATLALPWMESWAWTLGRKAALAAPPPDKLPLRMLFVFTPNGVHQPAWRPEAVGPLAELPKTLSPLLPHRKDLLVLSNLTLDGARAKQDGPGDHARAGAAFLTGAHPRKTDGADIENGISVDQVVAQAYGQETPFPSLELGCDPSNQGGNCDSGYSCAYSSNLSWSSPTSPLAKETSPRRVFERLFLDGEGLTPDERARRQRYRASVLDAVEEDAKRVKGKLGGADKKKLEEYLTAVRELERRLGKPPRERAKPSGGAAGTARDAEPPQGTPSDHREHIERQLDVVRLAFQTDSTRVATFMLANAGSNRSYRHIGVSEGHHEISHHGGDPEKQDKLQRINQFHIERLAYLLAQLSAVDTGRGSLLDHTMVVWGSAIGDGDRHDHEDLPILLAGGRAWGVSGGRHVRYARETPLCDLYLWMLQRAGLKATSFGDSRGPLGQL